MASYESAGRVGRDALTISSSVLCATALVAACFRTLVKLHYQRRLLLDDAFLLLAVLLLAVATGVYFAFVDSMYRTEAMLYDPTAPNLGVEDVLSTTLRFRVLDTAFNILALGSMYSVKFSFLFFFKMLVNRVHPINLLWHIVTWSTLAVFVIICAISNAGCPYFDQRSYTCSENDNLWKEEVVIGVTQALHLLDDLAILAIPILILRAIQVSPRTKFFLGISLCLGAATMIICIIRTAGLRITGASAVDVVWEVYWQYIEVCIAVTMVSLTAFRSLFVQHTRSQQSPPKPWYSTHRNLRRKRLLGDSMDMTGDLPPISRAHLASVSTLVAGNGRSVAEISDEDDVEASRTLGPSSSGSSIRIKRGMIPRSEPASRANSKGELHDFV